MASGTLDTNNSARVILAVDHLTCSAYDPSPLTSGDNVGKALSTLLGT